MKLFGSLDNYIQMQRERHGLSQAELALLMSVEHGASVSRYEQGLRTPNLETLLALEIVFDMPIRDIFAGITERVRENVTERARALLETVDDSTSQENLAKIKCLSRLAHPDDHRVEPLWEAD